MQNNMQNIKKFYWIKAIITWAKSRFAFFICRKTHLWLSAGCSDLIREPDHAEMNDDSAPMWIINTRHPYWLNKVIQAAWFCQAFFFFSISTKQLFRERWKGEKELVTETVLCFRQDTPRFCSSHGEIQTSTMMIHVVEFSTLSNGDLSKTGAKDGHARLRRWGYRLPPLIKWSFFCLFYPTEYCYCQTR